MDMHEFVQGCKNCDPRIEPDRADELLKAAAELGEAILKQRERKAKEPAIPYQQIVDDYNSICGTKLPRVTKLTDKRKRAIKTCIGQGFTIEELTDAFRTAVSTPFLTGKNERSWTANFDFIIKPDNLQKICEGAYGAPAQPQKSHSYDLDLLVAHAINNTPKIKEG
ncbi:MAG: hypothetical protein J6K17_14570 [Oscillospiraceae bacterium]|nr:hypothetical protein [Oscillospiraceae bacterium]